MAFLIPVAPMRGRGFGRGGMNNNRNDPFRSRPPNTSRPPSMHVDDFIKMEFSDGNSNQMSGPQGRRQDKVRTPGGLPKIWKVGAQYGVKRKALISLYYNYKHIFTQK